LLLACLLLSSCDDFQEFVVQNPCSFDVVVAFAGANPPPDEEPWPYADTVPASGEKSILTGRYAGGYPLEQRVQIRAPGHLAVIETIDVTEDDFSWGIPKSFCAT
jgi:hypothetical protein